MSIAEFMNRFTFDSTRGLYLGVERECFLVNQEGEIVSRADEVINFAHKNGWYRGSSVGVGEFYDDPGNTIGYELSSAQIELRTVPHKTFQSLENELISNDEALTRVLQELNLESLHSEVGPIDMPLDVYPDPTGRYQRIMKEMPRETLLAACRVIGTHVHVGMRDPEMALRVYNYACRYYHELCEQGNGSFGERLAIYRQMAPNYEPRPYRSWEQYYQTALSQGFVDDPRQCWNLIRISQHGTIEFRMFGATHSVKRILGWAQRCHSLCQEALVTA